jgi:hypothetical protein
VVGSGVRTDPDVPEPRARRQATDHFDHAFLDAEQHGGGGRISTVGAPAPLPRVEHATGQRRAGPSDRAPQAIGITQVDAGAVHRTGTAAADQDFPRAVDHFAPHPWRHIKPHGKAVDGRSQISCQECSSA